MSTQEQNEVAFIANRLTELCREAQYYQAQDELYADDAISIEPAFTQEPIAKGLEAIKEKGERFQASIAVLLSSYALEPVIAGNHFAIAMGLEATKTDGQELKMSEIAVYKVHEGKIVSEQFFY